MASVAVARQLNQQHPSDHAPTIQHQHGCSKRKRSYPDEEQVQPRCPSRRRQPRPAEPAPPQENEEEDEEEEEEAEDGDDDSDYRQDDSDQEEEGEEEDGLLPTPLAKQQQKQRGRSGETTAAGVSPRSGGCAVGWGGGAAAGGHECLVCGKVFGKACKLVRHAATHTGEKRFVCTEAGCPKAFATKDKLKRHALSHARRKAGLSASVGNTARREAETRQNAAAFAAKAAAAGISLELPPGGAAGMVMATATPPHLEASRMERERAFSEGGGGGWKHSCPTCGRNFLDNYHLKRHVKAIHEGPRPYKCEHPMAAAPAAAAAVAGAATTGSGAAAHPAISPAPAGPAASPGAAVASSAIGVAEAEAESDRPELVAAGPEEDKSIAREPSAGPAGERAAVGDGDAGRSQGMAGVGESRRHQGRVYGVCGAAFAKKWQLREHLFEAHGQTKFNSRQHQCSHAGCGRVFDRPSKLAAHVKTHKARFACEFEGCGAAFVLASGLNLHLKEEHPFRCGVCDKLFDREDKMQIHQGTHNRAGDGDSIRPYHCNVPGCGKAFTEKRNLNAHRRTQHTEGGRKRFRCEAGDCTMAFAHRHTLVKHVKREHENASSAATGGRRKKSRSIKDGKGGDGAVARANQAASSSSTRCEEDPQPVTQAGATFSACPLLVVTDTPQAGEPDVVVREPLEGKRSATPCLGHSSENSAK